VGVNARSLRTLDVDRRTPPRVIARMPAGVVAVAESGLSTAAEIEALGDLGYRAFLIGESLMRASDPGAALAMLVAGVGAGTSATIPPRDGVTAGGRPDRAADSSGS
jgi:indole-3-glycerol phosphate synthase